MNLHPKTNNKLTPEVVNIDISYMKNTHRFTEEMGEYFVCSELARQNILPLITPKNIPLFDIIATNSDGSKYIAIKVISMGIGNNFVWKFVKQITRKRNNSNLFLVLVDLKENEINDCYVFKYDDFADKASEVYNTYINTPNSKTGKARKETSFRWYTYKDFSEKDLKLKNDWSLISNVFS